MMRISPVTGIELLPPPGGDNCPSWWELLQADMESFLYSNYRWFLFGGTLVGAAVAVVGAWKLGRACPKASEAASVAPAASDNQEPGPASEDANEGDEEDVASSG